MAAITEVSALQNGAFSVSPTTMTASDTFTFDSTKRQLLRMRNSTGSPVNVTIAGSAPSATYSVPGVGTVDLSAGKTVSVGANSVVCILLSTISGYLAGSGACTITNGTGCLADILDV